MRLEYRSGASCKFWQIEVDGSCYVVQYGKIGTAGREQTKTFADTEAARTAADRKIAEKKKKGYVEVDVTSDAPSTVISGRREQQKAVTTLAEETVAGSSAMGEATAVDSTAV